MEELFAWEKKNSVDIAQSFESFTRCLYTYDLYELASQDSKYGVMGYF